MGEEEVDWYDNNDKSVGTQEYIAGKITTAEKQTRRRHLLGIFLVLIVITIWVSSSIFIQVFMIIFMQFYAYHSVSTWCAQLHVVCNYHSI